MGENELINVQIHIAGKAYPVRVKPAEERLVRELEKEINEQINQFQRDYGSLEKQDYLALTLITFAFEFKKNQHSVNSDTIHKKVDALDQILVRALH